MRRLGEYSDQSLTQIHYFHEILLNDWTDRFCSDVAGYKFILLKVKDQTLPLFNSLLVYIFPRKRGKISFTFNHVIFIIY